MTNPMADEGYAVALLRRAINSGVPVDHDGIAEETGCPVDIVRSLHERLASGKLPTAPPVGYRAPGRVVPPTLPVATGTTVTVAPNTTGTAPSPKPDPASSGTGADAMIDTGKAHRSAKVRRAAERAAAALDTLRAAIAAEADAEAAREKAEKAQAAIDAEEKRLLAELEALRAKKAATKPNRLVDRSRRPCDHPGCDRAFNTAQGLALHRTRVHGGAA